MKKSLALVFIALLLTLTQMQAASAAKSDGYMHTNQFYAVSFDGEGDAIVRAQIDIENTLDRPLGNISLEIPGNAVVYKIMQGYAYKDYAYGYGNDYYPNPEYQNPQALDYTKTLTSGATILNIELWNAIERNNSGSIIIFYKIPNYAQKDFFGNYSFDFKTIIDNRAVLIQNVRVAVNVQDGLSLKGGESSVDYRPGLGFMSEATMAKASDSAIMIDPYYRDYYYGIRNAQGLVKTATNLDPFESFHVKGNYGENWLALNFADIALWIIAAGIIIAGAAIIMRKAGLAKIKGPNGNEYVKSAGIGFASSALATVFALGSFIAADVLQKFLHNAQGIALLIMLIGLIASAGIVFLPSVYVTTKKGIVHGAFTFFTTLFFLAIFSIAAFLVLQALLRPTIVY